jgi:hypothetical protein
MSNSFTENNEKIIKKRRCSDRSHSNESSCEKIHLSKCFQKLDLTSTGDSHVKESKNQQPTNSFNS